jgi:hypothetical protein
MAASGAIRDRLRGGSHDRRHRWVGAAKLATRIGLIADPGRSRQARTAACMEACCRAGWRFERRSASCERRLLPVVEVATRMGPIASGGLAPSTKWLHPRRRAAARGGGSSDALRVVSAGCCQWSKWLREWARSLAAGSRQARNGCMHGGVLPRGVAVRRRLRELSAGGCYWSSGDESGPDCRS